MPDGLKAAQVRKAQSSHDDGGGKQHQQRGQGAEGRARAGWRAIRCRMPK